MKRLFLLLGVLLTTVCVSCSEKAKDAAAKSVENMEANGDDSVANTVAVADVAKENIEDLAEQQFTENTKVFEMAAEDVKEAIDLFVKNTEKVAESPSQNTGAIVRNAEQKTEDVELAIQDTKKVAESPTSNTGAAVRNAEEKTEDVELAIKHTENVVEKPTQYAGNVVRDAELNIKDVAVGNAQQPIEGIWDTGTENTKVEISQKNGEWVGKITSSDNQKATTGTVILKDLKKQHNTWKGKILVVKKQKWTDVEIIPSGTELNLIVSAGFSSKKVRWSKSNN